jgi:hypothetical protein
MALFVTAYFHLLHKFKQNFCQTASFCSSLSVQLLFTSFSDKLLFTSFLDKLLFTSFSDKLLFNSFPDKLLFQQAAAVLNRVNLLESYFVID